MKGRNHSVDTCKGIACIAVVFIHSCFPGSLGAFIKALSRFAVPYFFMISGYFVHSSIEKQEAVLKERIKRLSVIFGLTYLFCMLADFLLGIELRDFSARGIMRLIVFNDSMNIKHIWYLLSLIYCYLIIYVFIKLKIRTIKSAWLPGILLTAAVLMCEVLPLLGIKIENYYYRNTWIEGIAFVLLGYAKADSKARFGLTIKNYYFVIFCGIIITIIEEMVIGNLEISIGSMILAISLFHFSIEYPRQIRNSFLEVIGGKYSLYIYLFHWDIRYFEYKIRTFLPESLRIAADAIIPILVILETIIFSSLFVLVLTYIRRQHVRTKKILSEC